MFTAFFPTSRVSWVLPLAGCHTLFLDFRHIGTFFDLGKFRSVACFLAQLGVRTELQGSISSTFYKQLLHSQIPKAQKRQTT